MPRCHNCYEMVLLFLFPEQYFNQWHREEEEEEEEEKEEARTTFSGDSG